MKQDKFLIGILAGIGLLIIISVVVVLLRAPGQESYIADSTPEGVVHNYFLALQREEYEKAYGYLSDELKSKPDLDDFIRVVSNNRDSEMSLQLGDVQQGDSRTTVDISLTYYRAGGLFESNRYTNESTALLKQNADGAWRLLEFPYPYWGYDWNEER